MEYQLEIRYDHKAMTTMAKGIRKALQEEYYRKSTIIGCLFIGVGAVILLTSPRFGFQQIIAVIALVLWALYMALQDQVHGILAKMKIPAGMKKGMWTFCEDGFFSTTEKGISGFDYDSIYAMIECDGYLILCFSDSKGQIFDLTQLTESDATGLRKLLRKKTSITIQKV